MSKSNYINTILLFLPLIFTKLNILILKSLNIKIMKCADCNCFPEECESSPSYRECPNCSLEECCCWNTIKNFEKSSFL